MGGHDGSVHARDYALFLEQYFDRLERTVHVALRAHTQRLVAVLAARRVLWQCGQAPSVCVTSDGRFVVLYWRRLDAGVAVARSGALYLQVSARLHDMTRSLLVAWLEQTRQFRCAGRVV